MGKNQGEMLAICGKAKYLVNIQSGTDKTDENWYTYEYMERGTIAFVDG